MKTLRIVTAVTIAALSSFGARAADSGAEPSELRQRAETYQAQRSRNPDFQPGEGRLTPQQRAETPPKRKAQAKRAMRTEAKSAPPETRRAKAAKRVRSLKKIPGAFVRK